MAPIGKIEKWNDPALAKLDDGAEIADTKIEVVHREDSSGTTFILTDFLQGASKTWQKEIGKAGSEVKWPAGVGKERDHGVADYVNHTDEAIGYVDPIPTYNKDLDLQHAAFQNSDKSPYVHPKPENLTAAAAGVAAGLSSELTLKLTNKQGKDSYPISGAVWAVCYQIQGDKQKSVVDFLTWATHEGQQ